MANAETTLTLKKQTGQTWSNETVSVASKMPMPFVLQLHKKVRRTLQAHGGTITEEVFEPIVGTKDRPTSYIIAGNAYLKKPGDAGGIISAGFAITNNIPKEFWEEWLAQFESHDAVKNNMIFAHKESASVTSMTREFEAEKSGMERLNPAALPKMGKVTVETSDNSPNAKK